MSVFALKGGPLDGQTREVYGGLRVPLGYEYGWLHACGVPSLADSRYTHRGEWVEPEHDRQLDDVCDLCERYGSHDILTPNRGR